jgi:hypothetical protein
MTEKNRRNFFAILLICILIASLGGAYLNRYARSGREYERQSGAELLEISKDLSIYDIDVIFDPENARLICKQNVKLVNRDDIEFNSIYFHLYPNAFKEEKRLPFLSDEKDAAYPNGFSPGWIDLKSVSIGDSPVDYQIGGYNNNILAVMLDKPLKPGGSTDIAMEYSVIIPNSIGRFGYGENTFNIANWYPVSCVYDHSGWNTDPYYAIGDPFYSDVSNYFVNIKVPSGYVIASTGDIAEIKDEGEYRIWEIEALAVRDFVWIASERFEIGSRQVDQTTVYSYFFPESRESGLRALDYAAYALQIFNSCFGMYPYRQFSVVQSDFFVGGMEYPNLVMIDKNLYDKEQLFWLEYVTVHETAHQWWYGIVGNDQIDEPWLDEALTEYSTVLYYGHRYGQDKENEIYNIITGEGTQSSLEKYILDEQEINTAVDQPIYKFSDWILYDLIVYRKGAGIFREMHRITGDEVFYEILRKYFENNKFSNAAHTDLQKACEEVTGKSWDAFFQRQLE